jgi:hypothetical protein
MSPMHRQRVARGHLGMPRGRARRLRASFSAPARPPDSILYRDARVLDDPGGAGPVRTPWSRALILNRIGKGSCETHGKRGRI